MDLLPGFEFDDTDANSAEMFNTDPQPVVPKVSDAVWSQLCAATLAVRETEPWKTLYDSELIGIRDPESGEIMLLSVLGAGGNVFAVHLHLPPEGQRFWRGAMETDKPDETLMRYGLRMVECEWQNKSECEAEDIEIWQRFGKASRKQLWWPQFRSWLPGYSPWFIDESEARRLTVALGLLKRFFQDAKSAGKEAFSEFAGPGASGIPDWIPLYELKKNGTAESCEDWQLTRTPLPDPGPLPPVAEPEDELYAARLAGLPVVDDVWEIGATWQDTPVFDPSEDRPYLPKIALCLGHGIQSKPLPELYGGKTTDGEALRKVFSALAEAEGCLPKELRVSTDTAELALRSVAVATGMAITRNPKELLPEAFRMLSQFSSGGGEHTLDDLLKMFPPDASPEAIAEALTTMLGPPPGGSGDGSSSSDSAALLAALSGGGIGGSLDGSQAADEDFKLPVPVGETRYTLKVSLRYTQPEIWRRITIAADATFFHLHDAIQSVMPWDGSHLFEFVIGKGRNAQRIGIGQDDDYPIAGTRLIDIIGRKKLSFSYVYDFGDNWDHQIKVETRAKQATPDPQTRLLDGEGIAPPDDCGGLPGFYGMLSGEEGWSEMWEDEDIEHWRSGKFNAGKVKIWPVEKLKYQSGPLF